MKDKIKNIKPLIFLLSLILAGTFSGTLAYFTDSKVYNNIFDITKYNVKITEEFNNEFGTKKVNFVNDGTSDVLIRINYNEYWSKLVGEDKIILNNKINGENLVNKEWTEEFKNNFTYYDGWYYYNKLLKSNSSIQVLTSISLNEDLINNSINKDEYLGTNYDLDFNLETIQASNESASDIWGAKVKIDGDDALWEF